MLPVIPGLSISGNGNLPFHLKDMMRMAARLLVMFLAMASVFTVQAQTAPPVWHTSDQKTAAGSSTSLSVARPDNVSAGDLIILIFTQQRSSSNGTSGFSVPSGFTLIRSEHRTNNNGTPEIIAFYKIADNNEPANYTSTVTNWGNVPNWKAASIRVTGYNPFDPIGNHSGENSGTSSVSTLTVPSLNTTSNHSLIVGARAVRRLISSESVPSGMTEQFNLAGSGGGDGNGSAPALLGAEQYMASAGATGTKTFSWSGSARATGLMFAINPVNPANCPNTLTVNPGFESGVSSWGTWGSVTTSSDARTGSSAVQISGSSSGITQAFVGTPGQSYTATVWAKAQNTTWGQVWIEFFNSNWQLISTTAFVNFGNPSSYTSYSVTGIAPAGTFWVQAVAGGGVNAGGYLRVDDYCLTVPPVSPGGVAGVAAWYRADEGANAGGTFTWVDQSGNNRNAVQATAANQPTITANSINFNPAITFDGVNDFLSVQNVAGLPTGSSQVQQFAVGRHLNVAASWGRFFSYGADANGQLFQMSKNAGNANAAASVFTTEAISSSSEFANGAPVLLDAKYTGTQIVISSFGVQRAATTAASNRTTGAGTIGSTLNGSASFWDGNIPEIIVYPTNLSAAQVSRVNSYLALKYGITIDQTTARNYFASDGSTIFWNGTTNSSHKNNIAGIVRDDGSGLNQKQSRSVNPGLQVVIGNGNTIAATNAANNQNFPVDKSALVWSDNGASVASWTTVGAPANRAILPRAWRVQETGTVGSVKLQIPQHGAPNGLPATVGSVILLVDADGNFSSGAVSYTMTLNGSNWEVDVDFTNGQYFTFAICSNQVGVPTFTMGSTSTRCQGASTITYTATATNNTGITYTLDPASVAAGNVINAATGAVTYVGSYGGNSTITATAQGCGGPVTATHTVTIQGVMAYPSFAMGASSTRCQGEGIVTYTASATNSIGIAYSLDAVSLAAGNSINPSTGAVFFTAEWSGITTVTATATGCAGPIAINHTVTVTPSVAPPVFALGAASERCQGAGTVAYTASAPHSTGIVYSLDAESLAAGNSINPANGQVTFVANWTGTSTIDAVASGCNGPTFSKHVVTIIPTVGKPVFLLGENSIRCIGEETETYVAVATNATNITYSLDPASLAGGVTIDPSTGEVTYTASWNGFSTITATASGCSGPTSATFIVKSVAVEAVDDLVEGYQGKPIVIDVLANDLCDVDANSLVIISPPQFGNLQFGNQGQIIYLPAGNFAGNDEIVYQICSVTDPSICDQATVSITIIGTFLDPCAEATRNKTYYLPFEENTRLRSALLSCGSVNLHSNIVRSVVSIKIPYPGITITYDHWEDGYEADITNPVQATTQVWGDGNLQNGTAPGYPNDILPPGAYIVLDNQFQYNPRNPSTIVYDGRDKLFTRGDVAISKVTGDAGFGGGSIIFDVQNLKTNVYDISRYGEYFVMPFGENINLGGTVAFRYTGISVKAAENGTIINFDFNGDGVVDITQSLNEGEFWYYDGTASQPGVFPANVNNANDIKAGGTLTSNKPVGVDLIFGDGFNYGTRNLALLPSLFYSNAYYSPVWTTAPSNANVQLNAPVYVFFTNVLDNPITVQWTSNSSSGTVAVPANGSNYYEIPYSDAGRGYRFHAVGGESFTAVAVIDADADGSRYDWAFNLIPQERLTTFSSIAWAPGSRDGSGNYQPVWVTPTDNTTIYVKFDGNMTGGTATLSPCGLPYDIAVPLNYLESYRFYDYMDNDQSGMALFTCDDVTFTAVWGQDSRANGGETPPGSPAMDVGYVLEPKCLKAFIFANDDYRFTAPETPIIIEVTMNDFGFLATLNPLSVRTEGLLQPANGTIVVNSDGTITYTPNPGFEGVDVFDYMVCALEYPEICDIAKVTIRVTDCPVNASENLITGIVFVEQLPDNGAYNGENPAKGVKVDLYADPNCNGTIDAGEGVILTTISDPSGNYYFSVQNGYNAKDDFDPVAAFNGNDGGINWSTNWVEQNDDANFSNGFVRIMPDFSVGGLGNAIRLSGNATATLRGISRSLTFTGATGASLKFKYRREGLNNQGEALDVLFNGSVILVIDDGDYVGTDVNYHEVIYPLPTYNANGPNTVFFRVNSSVNADDYYWIDDVELVYFRNPACYIVQVDPSNTGGTYLPSSLNRQTAVFTGLGACESVKYLGVLTTMVAEDDHANTSVDVPVQVYVLVNDIVGNPDPTTVTTNGLVNQPQNGTVTVNGDGSITYTPNAGFIGVDDFEYRVCSMDDPNICDIAVVTITVSCFQIALQNTITGIVFDDINLNGSRQPGEEGRGSIHVNLYHDTNNNGVLNVGEPLVTTATTNSLGGYQLNVTPPSATATYRDQFNTNGSASGSNGTTNWASTPWVEINETNGFNTANVFVTGNQLRLQGANTFYLDQFNANTTANQTNGTTSWSGHSWVEIGESNGFSTTQITITSANGLRIAGNGTATVLGARRTVPLSGAGAAKLSFKATTFNLDINSWVMVEVASSTAGPWTTLTTIQGPSNAVVNNYNLTIPANLLSATTTIRFVTNGLSAMGSTRGVFFDDIQVRYVPSYFFVGAARSANLSNAVSATLSLDYAESGLDLAVEDYVDLLVSSTPSGPWTLLKRFTGADGNQSGTFSADISSHISANTTIRLVTSGDVDMTASNIINFDNVQISYQTPLPASYIVQLEQPIGPGYGLTTPLPSPTGNHTVSFAGVGAGDCENSFGLAGADLSILKTVSSETVYAGENITFNIIVTNNGPTNAASVIVTDQLPPGLTLVSAAPSTGSWMSPNWVIGSLPVGASAELILQVTVNAALSEGTIITNTATVTSSTPDPDLDNNLDTATTVIVCPDLFAEPVSNSPVCANGSIHLSETGGSSNISWNWSGPAGFVSTAQHPVINSLSIANSGTYSVTISTLNGCTDTDTVSVIVHQIPNPDLAKSSDFVCGVTTVTLTATPETGVTYAWSNGAVSNGDHTASVEEEGTYSVTVTDVNGCTAVAQVIVNYIICVENCSNGIDDDGDGLVDCDDPDCEMPFIEDIFATSADNCPILNNGEITVLPDNPGWEYSINGGTTFQTSNVFTGLIPGNYYIRIQNASTGCYFDSFDNPYSLTSVECIEICDNGIDDDGDGLIDCEDEHCIPIANASSGAAICISELFDISADASGGGEPYSYNWDNGLGSGSTHTVSPWETTVYYVTVTTPAGCSAVDSVLVLVVPCPEDCTDGIDNDGDGLVDCEDPDCAIIGKPDPVADIYQTCPGAVFQEQVVFNDFNLKKPIYSIYSMPNSGEVTMDSNGVFIYSPNAMSCVPDVFVYQVCNADYGCCDTASVTLNFGDGLPPVLVNVPADLTIGCDEQVPATPLVYGIDKCPGIFLSFTENNTKESLGACQTYTITRTWQATNMCGNSSSAEQVIHVKDISEPEIFQLYTLPNGKKMIAGISKNTSHRWKYVRFPINFGNNPIVLTQTITRNDTAAVTVRQRNISIEGFEMRLQEEEISDGEHGYEEVAWVAIEPGSFFDADKRMFAGLFPNANNVQKTLNFPQAFSGTPAFFANMQTTKDADPASIRINNLSTNSVGLIVEEEQSKDSETVHGNEDVGYFAMMPGNLLDIENKFIAEVNRIIISSQWTTVNLQNSYTKPVVIFGGLPTGGDPALMRVRNVTANSFEVRIEEWDYLDGLHVNRTVSYIVVEGGIPASTDFHCILGAGNLVPGVNLFVRDNCDNQVDLLYNESQNMGSSGLLVNRSWTAVDDCGNFLSQTRTDTCSIAKVRMKAFLNGALIGSVSSSLMRDDLRLKGLIPLTEPYSGMTGFQHKGQGGGETISPALLAVTGPSAIVDWVFLEIRDPWQPAQVLATRSALLQRDGGIVMANGDPVWGLPSLPESYYHVTVRHRNHLGLMTGVPVYLDNSAPIVDFADAAQPVHGGLSGGKVFNATTRSLWAGDLNGDRRVIFQGPDNDVFFLFSHVMSDNGNHTFLSNYISQGYYRSDLNMDGSAIYQGPNNDRSLLLFNTVLGHVGNPFNLANFIVSEKLP